jgi:hypothetical protein
MVPLSMSSMSTMSTMSTSTRHLVVVRAEPPSSPSRHITDENEEDTSALSTGNVANNIVPTSSLNESSSSSRTTGASTMRRVIQTIPPRPNGEWPESYRLAYYHDDRLPRDEIIVYELPEDAEALRQLGVIPGHPNPNRSQYALKWVYEYNQDPRNLRISEVVEYGSDRWDELIDKAKKTGTIASVDPEKALNELTHYLNWALSHNPKEAVPADGMAYNEILRFEDGKRVDLFTNVRTSTTPLRHQGGSAHADALELLHRRFRYEMVCDRKAFGFPAIPNPGARPKAIAWGFVDESTHDEPTQVVVNRPATAVLKERRLQAAIEASSSEAPSEASSEASEDPQAHTNGTTPNTTTNIRPRRRPMLADVTRRVEADRTSRLRTNTDI